MMPMLYVPEIHCDACIRAITSAVRGLDEHAVLQADLQTKQVLVTSAASSADVAAAIEEAGFTVEMA